MRAREHFTPPTILAKQFIGTENLLLQFFEEVGKRGYVFNIDTGATPVDDCVSLSHPDNDPIPRELTDFVYEYDELIRYAINYYAEFHAEETGIGRRCMICNKHISEMPDGPILEFHRGSEDEDELQHLLLCSEACFARYIEKDEFDPVDLVEYMDNIFAKGTNDEKDEAT